MNHNESLTNKSYQHYLNDEKVKLTRLMSVLGFLLYGAFLLVDYWALPSVFEQAVQIRGIVLSVFALTLWFSYHPNFTKFYNPVLIVQFSSAFIGVEALLYLSKPTDQGYATYFAGVIIILIALFSWTHLKRNITALLASGAIIGYLYIELTVRQSSLDERFPTLLANSFFLISAVIFGLVAQVVRDGYIRQNFILQQTLADSLLKKTVEANDNAYLANHDMLTGLPNRRFVMEQLEVSLTIAKEKNKILAVLFLDLNGFKQVNDTHGHKAGDEILIVVARRLEAAIRRNDCISRLGGDEYLIGLLLKPEQINEIEQMKEKFVSIISKPIVFEGITMTVGTSIGIAAYPMHGDDVGVLIDIADNKMYQHKEDRRSGDERRDDDLIERPIKDKYISLDILDEHAFDSLKKASEHSSTEFEIDFVDLPSKKESA